MAFPVFADGQNLWVLATSIGSRLIAYAIFYRQDNLVLGLRRVLLVEFQSLSGGEKLIGPALCWMFQRCREEGIHVLEYAGCWLDRPGLPRISAPYRRSLSSWTHYFRASPKDLSEMLGDPKT